jgi:hypothetical protein
MSQSLLLPAFVALFGIVAALFLVGFAPSALAGNRRRRARRGHARADDDLIGHDYDDDDYVEFILRREPDIGPAPVEERGQHPRPPSADAYSPPHAQPIGFAHNGSHVDNEGRFRYIAEFAPRPFGSRPDDRRGPRGQHYRQDPDDDPSYGRHSSGR